MPDVYFEGQTPILRVNNLSASLSHYIQILGFKLDWQGPYFASVSRDRCSLFLSEEDQGHYGTWVWIGVSDAEALHKELQEKGARVRHPPTNYPWAYEMQVEDPDGNTLRLGSDPLTGQPIGNWLDMDGNLWSPTPEGNWTRRK
jgi:predicted enzyme related to lactoylglutathione lyase